MARRFLAGAGAPELLLRILDYADTAQDVLAFALTCRFMSEVWQAKGAGLAVVWRLWQREMPFAEEALTLVRARRLFGRNSRSHHKSNWLTCC